LEDPEAGPVRNVGIISASQKIEDYEIASYGTLADFAITLGKMRLLVNWKKLSRRKGGDALLTGFVYNSINIEASREDSE
jgi:ferritin-like metal-binding protein YciE